MHQHGGKDDDATGRKIAHFSECEKNYRKRREGPHDDVSLAVSRGHLEYSESVSTDEHESDFAEVAGIRIEQAFALCSFASQLVGKALR